MTTPPPSPSNDDDATLYWLTMARRVLAGEIAPLEARHLIEGAPRKIRNAAVREAAESVRL
ncbi:MAG: hypothetical protein JSR72_12020 [Proteobacteria bacterium]|nr:hypothetical protein [Pseudomonadota bacterium]